MNGRIVIIHQCPISIPQPPLSSPLRPSPSQPITTRHTYTHTWRTHTHTWRIATYLFLTPYPPNASSSHAPHPPTPSPGGTALTTILGSTALSPSFGGTPSLPSLSLSTVCLPNMARHHVLCAWLLSLLRRAQASRWTWPRSTAASSPPCGPPSTTLLAPPSSRAVRPICWDPATPLAPGRCGRPSIPTHRRDHTVVCPAAARQRLGCRLLREGKASYGADTLHHNNAGAESNHPALGSHPVGAQGHRILYSISLWACRVVSAPTQITLAMATASIICDAVVLRVARASRPPSHVGHTPTSAPGRSGQCSSLARSAMYTGRRTPESLHSGIPLERDRMAR